MKKLILFFVTLTALNLNSQIAYSWAKQTGGTSADDSQSIAYDAAGNVYIAGSFQGAVDFDPGPGSVILTSAGSDDAFISKFDASGNFIAVYTFTNNLFCKIYGIVIDNAGNIITTGAFSGSVDFDPAATVNSKTSNGLNDIFVCKLSPTGTFMWVKAIGSFGSDDFGISVTADASANVLLTGYFQGSNVNFDVGASNFSLSAAGVKDIFVLKLNSAGVFTWAFGLGALGNEVGQTIKTDAAGNVYLGGYFAFGFDFDPGAGTVNLTSAGGFDAFIAKYTSAGAYVWVDKFSGAIDEVCYSIGLDASGNIYSTGTFKSTTDFDPGTGTYNITPSGTNEDVFVSKLTSAGAFVWAKQFGGPGVDFGTSISVDASGVYSTGYFNGTADFDPAPTTTVNLASVSGNDIFISKLDVNGNYVFAKSIGGIGSDVSRAIITPSINVIYTTGSFSTTVDFDMSPLATANLTCAGGTDAFLLKLVPCPVQTPTVTGTPTLICTGNSSSLSVTGPVNYTWTTNATNSAITVTPGVTTSYSVTGMFTNGCVHTGTITVQVTSCTGIKDIRDAEQGIAFYPNPVNSTLYISNDGFTKEAKFELLDVAGKIIKKGIVYHREIDLSNLETGMYFIKINFDNKEITKKIIKE